MKKYILLILLVVIIAIAGFGSRFLHEIGFNENNSFYIKTENLAFGYFDVIDGKSYKASVLKDQNEIIGEMVEIRDEDINSFIAQFGVNVINVYHVAGRKIVEGISKVLPYVNQNQQFNVQISIYDGIAKIGSPALLDGF